MTKSADAIEALSRDNSEARMASVVDSAMKDEWRVEEMTRLAEVLARSGTVLTFGKDVAAADVASTGGPASLSTLLCPLYLRHLGFVVPKLGVPGRPAGGIDVLAQVAGYQVMLDAAASRAVIKQCGYAHFLAGPEFAPLDAKLFAYRQNVGAQNVPALAVASILAKKIACGLTHAGLDVRVAAHGNFGADFSAARAAAKAFCMAADTAGIPAVAGLSDARTPYQPYIGRGESLLAVRLLIEARADPWLAEHADRCRLLAAHVGALDGRIGLAVDDVAEPFFANIVAQGGTAQRFYEKTDAVEKSPRSALTAEREGFLSLDMSTLRSVFVEANAVGSDDARFPDRLGLILRSKPGAYVRRGDSLAAGRAENNEVWGRFRAGLMKCFLPLDLMDYAAGMEEFVHA